MIVFSRERGWKSLHGDVETFCKIMQFEPDAEQLHYLLRVQNAQHRGCRLGLVPMEAGKAFQIIATAMFYRALVCEVPSYLFFEHTWNADKWVASMSNWGFQSSEPMRTQIQVSKQRKFLACNGTHICHVVGPHTKDDRFRTGKQDIVLCDFDSTPTERIQRACTLTQGAVLYIPNGALAEPEDRRETPDG